MEKPRPISRKLIRNRFNDHLAPEGSGVELPGGKSAGPAVELVELISCRGASTFSADKTRRRQFDGNLSNFVLKEGPGPV